MQKQDFLISTNRNKTIFNSCIILYIFLLVIPFLTIPILAGEIPMTPTTSWLISFFYSIASFIITYFHYKRLRKKQEEELNQYVSKFKKGLLVIFTYFFTINIESFPLLLINSDLSKIPLFIKIIYLMIYEIFQVLLILYILREEIKVAFQDIKKNHKDYFSSNLKYYLIAIITMMFSNLLISTINNGNIAGNEEAVRESFSIAPFYMYFSAVIIAPLLEELTFRQGIRNIFSNKKLFIIMSGLIFGTLHVVGNIYSITDLLYLIPYSVPGFAFAYMLSKTDNIFVPICFHFLHNGITMSLQVLLMIFGI